MTRSLVRVLPLSEKEFQAQVVELARLLGWIVYHPFLSKWSERGWPDLTLIRPPRLVFAELKRDGAKTTPAQDRFLALLGECGQEVYLWRPVDWDQLQETLR